jgi:hypothetical protein
VHTFYLDSTLLNLEVRSFTFIRSFKSVKSINLESKNIGKLIRDKILKASMEELRCKCLISWVWGYRGGVSKLNGGGYNL